MSHVHPTTRRAVALLAALALTLPLGGHALVAAKQPTHEEAPAAEKAAKAGEAGAVEVHFTDDSRLRVKLRDDKIELLTPYGKLLIPVAEVQHIEFATRVPADVAKKIDAAIANLASTEFKTREAATTELRALGAAAYPALLKASKNTDAEVARRAEELLAKVREEVSEDRLEVRPHDVVTTEHSKIAGRIQATSLKVATAQFGEQQMKLSDVLSLGAPGTESEPKEVAADAGPNDLMAYLARIGQTFRFRVTGAATGSVWGTDVYTGDSTLAAAAVHAGLLKPGQTGIVKVTILASPAVFNGSTRNGVTSMPYGVFPGAYKFVK